MPLALLLLAAQFDSSPPGPAEVQARAAIDAATEARRRVLHALCGDDGRERRLRDADAVFDAARAAYRVRFRRSWDTTSDAGSRQWECTLPDGFEWTLASYRNALGAIDAALAR